MSHPQDERIELLITRKLDGTISDEERLELDRAVMQSPEHRRVLEESERIDALCAGALDDEFNAAGRSVGEVTVRHRRSERSGRYWWCLPGAMAACLGLIVVSGWFANEEGERSSFVDRHPVPARRAPAVGPAFESRPSQTANGIGRPGPMRRVSTGADVMNRHRDTSVYGIVGEDGRIYLIEIERTRTYHYPFGNAAVRTARKGL
jgi:hypothetical protein